jgi:hypothetical protein
MKRGYTEELPKSNKRAIPPVMFGCVQVFLYLDKQLNIEQAIYTEGVHVGPLQGDSTKACPRPKSEP